MALVEGGWVYPQGVFRSGFDLAGSEGVIEWDSESSEPITRLLSGTDEEVPAVGVPQSVLAEDPYTTQIRHVHHALESGEPFAVTPEESLHALRVALAAKESLRTGRAVAS
jgi:myo-inositol 2-dehydrogenase/D-chiro-inositol 1-dehydrogenase